MTNALIIAQNIDPTLGKELARIVTAQMAPKVVAVAEVDRKQMLVDLLSGVFYEAGQPIETPDLVAMVNRLDYTLTNNGRFSTLTIEELKIIFYKGPREVWGKYYGLNVLTFESWIKAFLQDLDRAAALEKQKRFLADQAAKEAEPTAEQKEAILKEAAINKFEDWAQARAKGKGLNLSLFDLANTTFDWLTQKGVLTFTELDIEATGTAAVESLKADAERDRAIATTRNDKAEAARLGSFIGAIEAAGVPDQTQGRAKKLLLINFFEGLARNGQTLTELLAAHGI